MKSKIVMCGLFLLAMFTEKCIAQIEAYFQADSIYSRNKVMKRIQTVETSQGKMYTYSFFNPEGKLTRITRTNRAGDKFSYQLTLAYDDIKIKEQTTVYFIEGDQRNTDTFYSIYNRDTAGVIKEIRTYNNEDRLVHLGLITDGVTEHIYYDPKYEMYVYTSILDVPRFDSMIVDKRKFDDAGLYVSEGNLQFRKRVISANKKFYNRKGQVSRELVNSTLWYTRRDSNEPVKLKDLDMIRYKYYENGLLKTFQNIDRMNTPMKFTYEFYK